MQRLSQKFYLMLMFALLFCTTTQAQQQKVGYVNTDLILNEIPEYKGVQQQLQVLSGQWRAEIEKMQQEINTLKEAFEAKEILYTDEIRKQKQLQIEQKQQERQQYVEQKFGPEGEYFEKQQELLKPVQRIIFEAITVVAKREEYDFVFDRAQNSSLLFSRKEWNLNQDVLQELGISLNQ